MSSVELKTRPVRTKRDAVHIQRKNERYHRRLELDGLAKSRKVLREIKSEFTGLIGTPEKTRERIREFDFSRKYGNLISNQVMKSFVLGFYEEYRRRQGKALFAIGYDDVAERETWYEVYNLMGDKIAVDAEYFYSLDKTLRAKYWTIAKTKNEKIIYDMLDLITDVIAEGRTTRDFIADANVLYGTAGLDPLTPHHLAQVYRTNMSTAMAAAHEEFLFTHGLENSKLMWVTAGDDNVRPEHEALEGVVQTAVEWRASGLWAGNDYNCRCVMADVADSTKGRSFTDAEKKFGNPIRPPKDFPMSPLQMLWAA